MANILAASWTDGLVGLADGPRVHELAGRSVRGLAVDGERGLVAIVDNHSLVRRTVAGEWREVARDDRDLSCCLAVGDKVFVGTDDASLLVLGTDGELARVPSFDVTPGRDTWYAGAIEVDGRMLGPPLGIRSLAASASGAALFANVHVGGIPRSTDGGETWHPTIDVDADVHEVVAHPEREDVVIAAAAVGFCISRDGGATWMIETEGLHAHYCSAVAFFGDDVLVAASGDHFAQEGGVYRRSLDEGGPFEPLSGPPRWFAGIVDTGGLACSGSTIAIADRGGNVHVSEDGGQSWGCWSSAVSDPSCVLIGR